MYASQYSCVYLGQEDMQPILGGELRPVVIVLENLYKDQTKIIHQERDRACLPINHTTEKLCEGGKRRKKKQWDGVVKRDCDLSSNGPSCDYTKFIYRTERKT